MGSQRLKDIECELGEQKKSTAKITKLCLAAIKVGDRVEENSDGCNCRPWSPWRTDRRAWRQRRWTSTPSTESVATGDN